MERVGGVERVEGWKGWRGGKGGGWKGWRGGKGSAALKIPCPCLHLQVVGVVKITTLTNRQYCVILDPAGADGKPQLGQKKLVKGEKSFFLLPGESLEKGIQNVYVLGEDEGLILKASEGYKDTDAVSGCGVGVSFPIDPSCVLTEH